VEAPPSERHDERHVRFFCWLVGVSPASAPGADESPAAVIGPLLERLDEVIASDALRANLLPRAPHVVPQLMKTLRDESYSSVDVASRISRDVVLSAEVIKSATAAYRAKEDDEGEIDLARAVAIIGTAGLRRAIASVVLRPIFESGGDTLSAKAAVKIWRDADRKARLSAAVAGQESLDPFDGYLAGLLHNSGWTALLRAIDGFEDLIFGNADLAHPVVVPELLRRRDALFGAIVGPWNLSPAVDRLAEEVGRFGLDAARSPLGIALRESNRLAALYALAPTGQRPAAAVPGWATLPRPVQECYAGLARVG
jgi:HD-like signal output (HDOD) protein